MFDISFSSKLERIIDDIAEKGWSEIPNFLPEDFCRSLLNEMISYWNSGEFKKAEIGKGDSQTRIPEIRSDFIHWFDPNNLTELQNQYHNIINELKDNLNRDFYLGLEDFEGHFAVYPEGSFYKKHLDQFRSQQLRQITCILYLNFDRKENDGGELRIFTDEGTIEIIPNACKFICFRSDQIYHEVLICKSKRYSITGWLRKTDVFGQ